MISKNIIITGASSGVGFELAKLFLQNHHNVLAIARREENLKKLQAFSTDDGFSYIAFDISLPDFTTHLKEKTKNWNQVDILFNNAGLLIKKEFSALTEEDFLNTYKLNFLAPVRIIQTLLPKLNHNTHIINISTMGAVQGSVKFPELIAYSSSKASLNNLTEVLAVELSDKLITINSVALGAVQTEMLEAAFPGYKAPTSAQEMAQFLHNFSIDFKGIGNGKIIEASISTP